MDEVKLSIAQHKGIRAQELLDNTLFKESIAHLRADYLAEWENTPAKATDVRERIWVGVRNLALVEAHLRKLISGGKIATKDLADVKYLKR